jgi:hypothetical protein
MSTSTLASKPASIWAARASRTSLPNPMRQDIDVCEVSCGSPVKQGEQLVADQFFWRKRQPGRGRGGRKVRQCVNGQVNQDSSINTSDDHPAERVAVLDSLRGPASLADCGLQGIARGGNAPALGDGEEVEVFSGPRRQALREQGGSSREQKP